MSSHYNNYRLESIHHLKSLFPSGEANELNWCVLSTSGVHGTYATLDDLENDDYLLGEEDCSLLITVLVIRPRLVSMLYGNIEITKEDTPFLRKLVSSSLKCIQETQKENTLK